MQVLYHLFLPIFLYVFFTLYNLFLIYAFSSHVDMNGNIEDPHTFMVLFGWQMHHIWTRQIGKMMLQLKLQKENFDTHVTTWNPCNSQLSTSGSHHSTKNDPCNLASPSIFASNYLADYEELLNFVQRHTKFSNSTCLHKKGTYFHVTMVFHVSYKLLICY